MVYISELPHSPDKSAYDLVGGSISVTELALDKSGNDISKSLFTAARLITEVNYDLSTKDEPFASEMVQVQLDEMGHYNVVLAHPDDDLERINGVGVFTPIDIFGGIKLTELSVRPSLQRKRGYGSAILEHIEDSARHKVASSLHFYALDDSVGFYEKHGYAHDPDESGVMRKPLK